MFPLSAAAIISQTLAHRAQKVVLRHRLKPAPPWKTRRETTRRHGWHACGARCGGRRGERSERGSSSHLGYSSSALASSCIIHISFLAALVPQQRWRAKGKKPNTSWLEFRWEVERVKGEREREWHFHTGPFRVRSAWEQKQQLEDRGTLSCAKKTQLECFSGV